MATVLCCLWDLPLSGPHLCILGLGMGVSTLVPTAAVLHASTSTFTPPASMENLLSPRPPCPRVPAVGAAVLLGRESIALGTLLAVAPRPAQCWLTCIYQRAQTPLFCVTLWADLVSALPLAVLQPEAVPPPGCSCLPSPEPCPWPGSAVRVF